MEGDVIPHFLVSEEHQLMIRFVEGIGSDGTAAEASIPLLKKRISNLQKKTILPKLRM